MTCSFNWSRCHTCCAAATLLFPLLLHTHFSWIYCIHNTLSSSFFPKILLVFLSMPVSLCRFVTACRPTIYVCLSLSFYISLSICLYVCLFRLSLREKQ